MSRFFSPPNRLDKSTLLLAPRYLLHKMEMKEVLSAPPSEYQELQFNSYIIVLNVFLHKNVMYGFSFLQQSIVDCSYPCQKCGWKLILIKLNCKSLICWCFVKIRFVGCEFFFIVQFMKNTIEVTFQYKILPWFCVGPGTNTLLWPSATLWRIPETMWYGPSATSATETPYASDWWRWSSQSR